MRFLPRCGVVALAALTFTLCQQGTAGNLQATIQVGKPAPVISATAASGRWLERAALDPATFGKVRGVSPATSPESKIVVYTRVLDSGFFRLAFALDRFIARHPKLEWSFVQVMDPLGAQNGGYTADALQKRVEEIRKLAESHRITHLSFLVSAPNAASLSPRLGLVGDNNVLVLHLARVPDSDKHPLVDWLRQAESARLTPDSVQEIIASLTALP